MVYDDYLESPCCVRAVWDTPSVASNIPPIAANGGVSAPVVMANAVIFNYHRGIHTSIGTVVVTP